MEVSRDVNLHYGLLRATTGGASAILARLSASSKLDQDPYRESFLALISVRNREPSEVKALSLC